MPQAANWGKYLYEYCSFAQAIEGSARQDHSDRLHKLLSDRLDPVAFVRTSGTQGA